MMDRAIDVISNIHVQQEIDRLKKDIEQKCDQIAELYGDGTTWTPPVFYKKINGKRKKL